MYAFKITNLDCQVRLKVKNRARRKKEVNVNDQIFLQIQTRFYDI